MSSNREQVRWGRVTAGAIYVLLGTAFLLEALGVWTWSPDTLAEVLSWSLPVGLVAVGVAIGLGGLRSHGRSGAS